MTERKREQESGRTQWKQWVIRSVRSWGRDTAEPEGVWGREGGERAEMLV